MDINDPKLLREWLNRHSPEVGLVLACRAALRALPMVNIDTQTTSVKELELVQKITRGLVIATVAVGTTTSKIKSLAGEIAKDSYDVSQSPVAQASYRSGEQSNELVQAVEIYAAIGDINTYASLDSGNVSTRSALTANAVNIIAFQLSETWQALREDIRSIEFGTSAKQLLETPLWSGTNWLSRDKEDLRRLIAHPNPESDFWIDWYQGILEGRPPNWEMLEEIALIDPEDWNQGAEHVNGLIAEIQARYAVKESVKEAQIVLNDAPPANAQMGHNNPPDDIENIPDSKEDEELIARILGELKDVSDETTPDASKVENNVVELRAVFTKIGKWFAKKLDMTIDTIIKTLAAGTTIAFLTQYQAWLLSLWAKLQPVIETVTNWIPLIG